MPSWIKSELFTFERKAGPMRARLTLPLPCRLPWQGRALARLPGPWPLSYSRQGPLPALPCPRARLWHSLRSAMAAAGSLALASCVAAPSSGPIGFHSYGTTPDGKRVRLYTTYLPDGTPGRTTGRIGDESVNWSNSNY